eukprot:1156492-Pelagomonas_calceolata.AAC.9
MSNYGGAGRPDATKSTSRHNESRRAWRKEEHEQTNESRRAWRNEDLEQALENRGGPGARRGVCNQRKAGGPGARRGKSNHDSAHMKSTGLNQAACPSRGEQRNGAAPSPNVQGDRWWGEQRTLQLQENNDTVYHQARTRVLSKQQSPGLETFFTMSGRASDTGQEGHAEEHAQEEHEWQEEHAQEEHKRQGIGHWTRGACAKRSMSGKRSMTGKRSTSGRALDSEQEGHARREA